MVKLTSLTRISQCITAAITWDTMVTLTGIRINTTITGIGGDRKI
jgi:hypothetical protein